MKLKRYLDENYYSTWDELMSDVVKLIEEYEQGTDG